MKDTAYIDGIGNVRPLTPDELTMWRLAWGRKHPDGIPGRQTFASYLRSQVNWHRAQARRQESAWGQAYHEGIALGLRYALDRYFMDLRVERALAKRRHA